MNLNTTQPTSQMESMPPGFETQFSAGCTIEETQSDTSIADARSPPRESSPPNAPFNLHDREAKFLPSSFTDNMQRDGDSEPSQVDIFQGNSLFGGDVSGESVPGTPSASPASKDQPDSLAASPNNPPSVLPESSQVTYISHSPLQSGNDYIHSANQLPPYPVSNPVLDPSLGTQVPGSQSPLDYYGSAEDNEDSEGPEPRSSLKYGLRKREKGPMTTHLDCDRSGDYDPAQERKKVKKRDGDETKSRKRRSGQLVQGDLDDNGQPHQKKQKPMSLPRARFTGSSRVYIIKLRSDAGKELLDRYKGEDNWPQEPWNFLSDEYIAQNWVEDEDDNGEQGSSRRGRRALRRPKRNIRYNSPPSDDGLTPIPDPLGEKDDLRHHPAARGCVSCRQQNRRCSLLASNGAWPCCGCVEKYGDNDVIHCELIIPPPRKTPCESCLDSGQECSYNDPETNYSHACQQCQEAERTCIAGPDIDSLPKRVTYTPPPGVNYVRHRPFISCTACRQVKRSCSLKSKLDEPPCRACKKAGIPCTFERLVPTNAGKQRAATRKVNEIPTESSSSSDEDDVGSNAPARLSSSGGSKQVSSSSVARKVSNFGGISRVSSGRTRALHVPGGPARIPSSSYLPSQTSKAPNKAPPKKNPRDSGIAGIDTERRPSRPNAAEGPSATKTNAVNITTFRSGVNTATETRRQTAAAAAATRHHGFGYTNSHKRDRVKHINPVSTLRHAPAAIREYQPSALDAPASYHLPPAPGARLTHMSDADGHDGYFREIVTALAHPVTFATAPESTGGPAGGCRFCTDPLYGLLGLSWKKASVIAWDDGRGFTEVMDGHRENGAQAASMCRGCVMGRVDILSCVDHRLEAVVSPLMRRAERDRRCAEYTDRLSERRLRPEDRWCSVCVSPAMWKCCAEQEADEDGDEYGVVGAKRPSEGCGLFLCEDCERGWRVCGEDFQDFLEQKLATERGVVDCRADAAFLLEEGLLMKNVAMQLAP